MAGMNSSESPVVQDALFQNVMNVVVDGSLSVLGICCNILAILVLQVDRHKLSMSVLLQGLAVSDILFLIYTLLYTTLRSIYPFTGRLEWVYKQASPYIVTCVLPCGWIAQTTTIWLVVAVTLDRFIYVCHPFSSLAWCTVSRARFTVLAIWLASVIFNCPRFFYYYHMSFESAGSQNSSAVSTFVAHQDAGSDFWESYRTVYHIGLTLVLLFVIPLPVLICLNARLVRVIAVARRRQVQLSGSQKEKVNLGVTLNLVVVVTVFIVCETPDFVASIITLDTFSSTIDPVYLENFLVIRESLLVLNAASNFFIYCLFYSKFRRLLKFVVFGCRLGNGQYFSETEPDRV